MTVGLLFKKSLKVWSLLTNLINAINNLVNSCKVGMINAFD